MGCLACSTKVILCLTAVSSLVFLTVGAIFVAPFWLFDGASFLVTSILGYLATKHASQSDSSAVNTYATAAKCVAGVSIPIELGFLITAVVLWHDEMNPVHRTSYGRDGDSFFFCSLYSSTLNLFVALHYSGLERTQSAADDKLAIADPSRAVDRK